VNCSPVRRGWGPPRQGSGSFVNAVHCRLRPRFRRCSAYLTAHNRPGRTSIVSDVQRFSLRVLRQWLLHKGRLKMRHEIADTVNPGNDRNGTPCSVRANEPAGCSSFEMPDLGGSHWQGRPGRRFTRSRLVAAIAAGKNLALVVRGSNGRDIPLDCEYRGGLDAAWFALRMPVPGLARQTARLRSSEG